MTTDKIYVMVGKISVMVAKVYICDDRYKLIIIYFILFMFYKFVKMRLIYE